MKTLISILMLCALFTSCQGQNKKISPEIIILEKNQNKPIDDGNPYAVEKYFGGAEYQFVKNKDYNSFIKIHLNCTENDSFIKINRHLSKEEGYKQTEFSHYYKGILVEYDIIGVKEFTTDNNGAVDMIGGQLQRFKEFSTIPTITLEQATELAKQEGLKVREYYMPDMTGHSQRKTKEEMEKEALTKKIETIKYYGLKIILEAKANYFCYEFYVDSYMICIDAHTGNVVRNQSTLIN